MKACESTDMSMDIRCPSLGSAQWDSSSLETSVLRRLFLALRMQLANFGEVIAPSQVGHPNRWRPSPASEAESRHHLGRVAGWWQRV
jgi:hypothetical protein